MPMKLLMLALAVAMQTLLLTVSERKVPPRALLVAYALSFGNC